MDVDFILFLKQYVLFSDDYDLFSTCFEYSIKETAKKLGMPLSTFKKRCRKCGIKRWPSRKIAALRNLKNTIVNECLSIKKLKISISSIDTCIMKTLKNPNYKIPYTIKKAMNKVYKQSHMQKKM